MAGCVSCFILPLILFLFHRFIQPIILKYFNPWVKKPVEEANNTELYNEENKQNAENNKSAGEGLTTAHDSKRLKED